MYQADPQCQYMRRYPSVNTCTNVNTMHGNNVLLQVHRNNPYRQIELSGIKTQHCQNLGDSNRTPVHKQTQVD